MRRTGENLPIIGPATNLLVLPAENPDLALKGLKGDARLFVEAELAIARCNFARGKSLSEKLLGNPHYFFAAVRIGVISAIGLADLMFFNRIMKMLKGCSEKEYGAYCKLGVEIAEAWIRQWMWIPTGYPEWMCRFDLGTLPEAWRRPSAYLGVKFRLNQGQFESAYAAASLFLNFICPQQGITAANVYAKIACAIACRETGRKNEMMKWLGETVRLLAPHGMILPFILFMHGSHRSPVEEIMAEVAPDLVPRLREIGKSYFVNLIRIRNQYMGERTTESLSFREFYLAMLLKRDVPYKELADRVGISVGRIRNLVSILYEKLGIHSRRGLRDVVW